MSYKRLFKLQSSHYLARREKSLNKRCIVAIKRDIFIFDSKSRLDYTVTKLITTLKVNLRNEN